MKRLMPTAAVLLAGIFYVGANAQSPAPPGAGDRNIGDRSIKDRSIELERVDREMRKADKAAETSKMNFAQIKEDFEQIQVLFDSGIVKTYQMTNPMNYGKISDSASELKDRATRLRSNLFPDRPKKAKDKKDDAPIVPLVGAPAEVVKNLIINMNGTLASFVASPIFQNAKVIEPKVSEQARVDLENIIAQSTQLSEEAGKLK
ncbi:MAG: hypothetical protein ABI999_04840 [Acidobacteriota bacterium]